MSQSYSLPKLLVSQIEGLVESGHFSSRSDVVKEALRFLLEKKPNLKQASGVALYKMGTVTLTNTIIANNPNGGDCLASSPITSMGHNLDSDDSCGLTSAGDLSNIADPKLGPLQLNGGPTLTHALLEGSPAIDAGDNSVLEDPLNLTTDQRGAGFPRRAGDHVDIGSFELGATVPPGPIEVTNNADSGAGSLRDVIANSSAGLINMMDKAYKSDPERVWELLQRLGLIDKEGNPDSTNGIGCCGVGRSRLFSKLRYLQRL